jgi:methylmalonyl-CoA mutase C-terminal domain/subunit
MPARVLAAKLGLDGHDRGIRLIARELRERGVEVVYLGIGTSAAQAAHAAVQDHELGVEAVLSVGMSVSVAADAILRAAASHSSA